jgi:hypothetical protein
MQGSHRDKKSFPLTLGDEEGHEGTEADLGLLGFPLLDAYREPLFRRRLEGEKMKKKFTTQQMNTSSIPSTSPCLQIIATGDLLLLQWLLEEEEEFHAALATKLIKECQSEGVEHIYLILVT